MAEALSLDEISVEEVSLLEDGEGTAMASAPPGQELLEEEEEEESAVQEGDSKELQKQGGARLKTVLR